VGGGMGLGGCVGGGGRWVGVLGGGMVDSSWGCASSGVVVLLFPAGRDDNAGARAPLGWPVRDAACTAWGGCMLTCPPRPQWQCPTRESTCIAKESVHGR
jgi:hypothetical protein